MEQVKKHPAVWEGEHDIATRKEMVPFLQDLKDRVWTDGFDRSDWEVKMEHFYNVRYAYLEEEVDWPWPGAADIMIPMSDMIIDRMKPGMTGLVENVNPVVSFQELLGARERGNARKAEYTMDYLLKTRDSNFLLEYAKAIDNTLSMGYGVLHQFYEYRTELQRLVIHKKRLPAPLNGFMVLPKGNMALADLVFKSSGGAIRPITKEIFDRMKDQIRAMAREAWNLFETDSVDRKALDKIMAFLRGQEEVVEVVVRQELSNTSRSVCIDNFDLWVPSYTKRIENASRVTTRVELTPVEVMRRQRDENWNAAAVDQLLNGPPATGRGTADRNAYFAMRSIEQTRSEREGISGSPRRKDDTYELFVSYCWMPIYGEKELTKGVIVWTPGIDKPLKACPLPYNHGKWPFAQIRFEVNDDRFYSSRGIPEKIADLENEETWQVREYLNNLRIINAPTFMYEEMTNFNPQDIPWTPGQFIKVGRVDRVAPLAAPDRTISIERMSLMIRNMIEQYTGSPDLAMASVRPGSTDEKTATEVNAIGQLTRVAHGYHSQVVQWGMKEVYKQYWSNWIQWGPDEFNIRIAGSKPARLTKQDIMGDFELIPRGTAGNVSPELETQKALQRVFMLAQFKQALDADPKIRYQIDLPEAIKDYLEKDDYVVSRRLLTEIPEEERQARMQAAAKQQAMQMGAATNSAPVPLEAFQQKLQRGAANAPHGSAQLVS